MVLITSHETQTLREQINSMQKEIDNLVEQRDEAMDISEQRCKFADKRKRISVERGLFFLWMY